MTTFIWGMVGGAIIAYAIPWIKAKFSKHKTEEVRKENDNGDISTNI